MTKIQYRRTKKIAYCVLGLITMLLIGLISSFFYIHKIQSKNSLSQIKVEVLDYDLIDKTVELNIKNNEKEYSRTIKLSEQKDSLPSTKLYNGTYLGKGTIKTETGDLWVLNRMEPYYKKGKWAFERNQKLLVLVDTRGTATSTDDVVVMVRTR